MRNAVWKLGRTPMILRSRSIKARYLSWLTGLRFGKLKSIFRESNLHNSFHAVIRPVDQVKEREFKVSHARLIAVATHASLILDLVL